MTVVSRAFQVLSDSDKKAKFDRFGGDPDNRFNGASASSPFSGFARSPGGGGGGASMFEEEISPEEMFRQFFGGGGGPFGPGFGTFRHTCSYYRHLRGVPIITFPIIPPANAKTTGTPSQPTESPSSSLSFVARRRSSFVVVVVASSSSPRPHKRRKISLSSPSTHRTH